MPGKSTMYCKKSFYYEDRDEEDEGEEMEIDYTYIHHYREPMKRLFVRTTIERDDKKIRKYVPIGWICPKCKDIKLDDNLSKSDLKGNYSHYR